MLAPVFAVLLLPALCFVESGGDVRAVNRYDGASPSYGLCQIKLGTAREMLKKEIEEEDLLDPAINKKAALLYLQYQMQRYPGDVRCAISAYNAGRCLKGPDGKIRNVKYVNNVLEAL